MNRIPVFDAHCDTISLLRYKGEGLDNNSGMVSLDLVEPVLGPYCQVFALFADSGRPGHATYEQLRDAFRGQMAAYHSRITHCRTAEEAEAVHKAGKIAAFLSVEGSELLGCDPERLAMAAQDGVVAVNLTWNHANAVSGSCREETDRGLSPLGCAFVRKMNELHVLVDVSHLSDPGFWDVIELSTKPIIASHSNARAVWGHARNLTDEQITAIIKNRGVIGLNFYRDFIGGSLDFDAIRTHLDHMLDLGGEGSVALGGDWDGCDTIDQMPTIVSLARLYEYLLARRYPEGLVQDIFYENLMRVVRER